MGENINPTSFSGEEEENAVRFFEGDMVMTREEYEDVASGSDSMYGSVVGKRWPNPTKIPYVIHSDLRSEPQAMDGIRAAIDDYKKYLCLQFVPMTNERNYVQFGGYSRGCSSPVGYDYRRTVNGISLVSGCWRKGTIMHEMAHTLGLYHEQSRPDRDSHVTIKFENIKDGRSFNFNKLNGIKTLNTKYDYDSMMHYGAKAFSKNGKITIETKDRSKQYVIGQRDGFSQTDIQELKKMYPNLPATCGYSTPCKDLDSRCAQWSKYCRSSGRMQKNCRKHCRLC